MSVVRRGRRVEGADALKQAHLQTPANVSYEMCRERIAFSRGHRCTHTQHHGTNCNSSQPHSHGLKPTQRPITSSIKTQPLSYAIHECLDSYLSCASSRRRRRRRRRRRIAAAGGKTPAPRVREGPETRPGQGRGVKTVILRTP